MKKTMVYVIALALSLTALLSGCGEMRGKDGSPTGPTAAPTQTILPETIMPDPEDGIVRDSDGIITDGDSGTTEERRTTDLPKFAAGTAGSENITKDQAKTGSN